MPFFQVLTGFPDDHFVFATAGLVHFGRKRFHMDMLVQKVVDDLCRLGDWKPEQIKRKIYKNIDKPGRVFLVFYNRKR
jgi:hypothetical protein